MRIYLKKDIRCGFQKLSISIHAFAMLLKRSPAVRARPIIRQD